MKIFLQIFTMCLLVVTATTYWKNTSYPTYGVGDSNMSLSARLSYDLEKSMTGFFKLAKKSKYSGRSDEKTRNMLNNAINNMDLNTVQQGENYGVQKLGNDMNITIKKY